jgi:hypothetical protein
MKQLTLAAVGFERYAKTTRRAAFLAEMERVVPWPPRYALIEPFYPKPGNGRPPVGVERMLRLYFLQQRFKLSDPAVEEALYDSLALRCFVGIDLGREPVPDETTVCRFRYDHPFLIGLARQNLEVCTAEGAESGGIADGDVILVKLDELLPLQCRRLEPIWPEGGTGAGFHVEITCGGGDARQCRRQHGSARAAAWARDPGMG